MTDLRALYQDVILDHYRRPRNFGELEEPMRKVEGYNPLCGDKVTLFLRLENDRVADIRFSGVGCAISTASASLMTEAVKGKTAGEARALLERFRDLLTSSQTADTGDREAATQAGELEGELGKLEVLSGVRDYPVRIKCATLAWHALKAALDQGAGSVSTE